MPPSHTQTCGQKKKRKAKTTEIIQKAASETVNGPSTKEKQKRKKAKREPQTLTLIVPVPDSSQGQVEDTSGPSEDMVIIGNPGKEEAEPDQQFDLGKLKVIIINTRKFLTKEKEQWEKGGKTANKKNLQRGAKVLMRPLSMPRYLDEINQGMFYQKNIKEKGWRAYVRGKHGIWGKKELGKMPEKKNIVAKAELFNEEKFGYGGRAHVGLYPNIFTGLPDIEGIASGSNDKIPPGERFDKAINYKVKLAKLITDLEEKAPLQFITVRCENNYPPLMVMINVRNFVGTYFNTHNLKLITPGTKELSEEYIMRKSIEPFTLFLMHFFIGILNKTSRYYGVNVDMTMRTSFGYDTPSIADTPEDNQLNGCFRVNLGLMTPAYAYCVYLSLKSLDDMLNLLIKENMAIAKLNMLDKEELKTYHKKETDSWKTKPVFEIKDCLQFAFFPIEKRNGLAIHLITRSEPALDFINKTAFNKIRISNDRGATAQSLKNAFESALNELFDIIEIKNGSLTTNVYLKLNNYESSGSGSDASHGLPDLCVSQDKLSELSNCLKDVLSLTQRQIKIVFGMISNGSGNYKKIEEIKDNVMNYLIIENQFLATFIDMANELIYYLILKQLENTGDNASTVAGGYGSDSDCEDVDSGIVGQKITTHNGMRAILSSPEAIREIIKLESGIKIKLDVEATYYEVKSALPITLNQEAVQTDPHAVLRDNNAIVKNMEEQPTPVHSQFSDSGIKYWVIDVTSSTQEQMKELLSTFKEDPKELLFLVSSGFKNEQGGSEKNPYGTVRIFASKENKENLNAAIARIKQTDMKLSGLSHHIRRMHKLIGNVPRNESILKNNNGAVEEQIKNSSEQ